MKIVTSIGLVTIGILIGTYLNLLNLGDNTDSNPKEADSYQDSRMPNAPNPGGGGPSTKDGIMTDPDKFPPNQNDMESDPGELFPPNQNDMEPNSRELFPPNQNEMEPGQREIPPSDQERSESGGAGTSI